ncbi:hypothetical protein SCP_0506870 [Sparassis crispa]|uniref:Uncharacterized protein n=1 Tax=Sparassis crispa TaxID=139825 RepID=A0A401GN57_9APHY|nr:hypothetical protein SCP_0506870 [Sparassis crispa]GBE83632.1 hypothetical protein SCP_0506870 [Sparassis crispa]
MSAISAYDIERCLAASRGSSEFNATGMTKERNLQSGDMGVLHDLLRLPEDGEGSASREANHDRRVAPAMALFNYQVRDWQDMWDQYIDESKCDTSTPAPEDTTYLVVHREPVRPEFRPHEGFFIGASSDLAFEVLCSYMDSDDFIRADVLTDEAEPPWETESDQITSSQGQTSARGERVSRIAKMKARQVISDYCAETKRTRSGKGTF